MLPEEIVDIVNLVEPETKLNYIRSKLPKHVIATLHEFDDSRFEIHILWWTGKSSYIATLNDFNKFINWIVAKCKTVQELYNLNKSNIKRKLHDEDATEQEIAKLFKNKHKSFVLFLQTTNTMNELSEKRQKQVELMVRKPSLCWSTDKIKLNKIGVKKLK